MMLRKNIDEILINACKPDPFISWGDNFLKENLQWLEDIVQDVKQNGFQRPKLPKTPAAVNRTRKRCRLSTIQETDVVNTASPARGTRVTRLGAKIAKHKLWTLEASPDPKPSKKRKGSVESVSIRLFEESVVSCSPESSVTVKTELIVLDEQVDEQHQDEQVCEPQVSQVTGSPCTESVPSLSTDSGFDAKMEVECLNSTVVLKPSCAVLDSNSELILGNNVGLSPVEQQSLIHDKQVCEVKNVIHHGVPQPDFCTPCKQEPNVASSELPCDEMCVDLITPYKKKLSSISDVSSKNQSITGDKCELKHNLTYEIRVGDHSTVEPVTVPLNNTFVVVCNDVTQTEGSSENDMQREESLGNQTKVHQASSKQSNSGEENHEIKTILDGDTATCQENETPDCADHVQNTPQTPSTNLQYGTECKDVDNMCDPKTPESVQRPTRIPRSVTPKKNIQAISPFVSESVKKRIAAYEILQSVAELHVQGNVEGTRMTRTKTRAAAAAAAAANTTAASPEKQPQKKQKKHDIETQKKLTNQTVQSAKQEKRAKDFREVPGKENSGILTSPRSVIPNMLKSSTRTPYMTPHILGNMCNVSSLSAKNSALMSGKKNLLQSGQKSCQRIQSQQVLGDIHNFSTLSAKSISTKPGVIIKNMDTFINKVPVKPTLQEKEGKKLEEQKKRREKEEEVKMKREEFLRERSEAQKRKREEKMRKVLEARQAQEKEKEEQQRLLLEVKTHRINEVIREQEAKQKEQISKKKLHTQQKIAEVEERRKLEEAARLAKLMEQEEEQQRIQALRKKEQEEAEKLRQKRLAEEKEAALLREGAEQLTKEAKVKLVPLSMKQLAENKVKIVKPHPNLTGIPEPQTKSSDDYGIDDIKSDASSDEEERPKKIVPAWAKKQRRVLPLKVQSFVPENLVLAFASCSKKTHDLTKLFPSLKLKKRTSSAVWSTPPQYTTKDIFF